MDQGIACMTKPHSALRKIGMTEPLKSAFAVIQGNRMKAAKPSFRLGRRNPVPWMAAFRLRKRPIQALRELQGLPSLDAGFRHPCRNDGGLAA
jgi:hypothetical protein